MNKFELARFVDGILKPEVRHANSILRFGDTTDYYGLKTFRDKAFVELINYCYATIPYYQEVMRHQGMQPSDVKGLEDIIHFPVLTKEIIRQQGARLRPAILKTGSYVVRRSGGTTGEPIASYINTLTAALETYSYFRGLQWMGWKPEYKRVLLTGGSLGLKSTSSYRFKLKSYATGIIPLPAFELKDETLSYYVKEINDAGLCIVTGYASVLKYFSDLCNNRGISFNNVKQVFSTAEVLPQSWHSSINECFACDVKSFYGCGEINSLGYQVEMNGNYVVPDEHVVVESIGDNSSVETDSLLITSLFNFAQPLIRYANGDMGMIRQGNAVNSRTVITELNGRVSDMFVRPDGTKLSGSFGPHSIFKGRIPVQKYQYIQHAYDEIEFRYNPIEEDISDDHRELLRQMLMNAFGDVKLSFTKTNEFILSSNGKHRIMITRI